MPTSATGTSNKPRTAAVSASGRRAQRGMTLIEILVVVLIIGALATLVTLSIGVLGEDRELERESERLMDTLSVLQEQAQLEGRDYGLRVETGGYELLRFSGLEQRWVAIPGDRWLQPRQLPAGLACELVLEGRPVLLRRNERPEARLPQVIASGSGDVTPFRLALVRGDTRRRIVLIGHADGSLEVMRDDAG